MANTVSLLSYANTFGDWVVTTNALTKENNNLASNNYTKSTGTLYLSDPALGLQVAKDAIFAGQLQVQGTGSSAYIQNNLRVDTQVYFQNTTLGLTNTGELISNGRISASASGIGLAVSNNATISGYLRVSSNSSITGATALGSTLSVTGATTLNNTLSVTSNVIAQNYVNVSQDVNAINFNGTGSVNSYGLNVIGNGGVTGQFSVGGNFVINGSTVYNTNKFEINANSVVGLTSYYNVNRGVSANAQIRWNEANTYWDIRDVNNPTSYSKILTANLITDSVTTINSNLLASTTAANTLFGYLTSNIAILQSQSNSNVSLIQGINTSQNTDIAIIQGVNVIQNTAISSTDGKMQSGYNQANTGTVLAQAGFNLANTVSSNTIIIQGVDVSQNARMAIIEGTDVSQNVRLDYSNTAITIVQGVDVGQNTRMTIIEATDVGQNTAISATNGKMQSAFDTANNRVSSITGTANQITVTGTLTPTLSLPQNVHTGTNFQVNSLGVGTGPTGTTGEIRATNNITAYYSDDRLKTRLGNIENALAKVMSLNGFHYTANETAQALGYTVKPEIGLSAQEVQSVLPEVVVPAPIDEQYLTIHYERVIPLLVEAIKELSREVEELKKK